MDEATRERQLQFAKDTDIVRQPFSSCLVTQGRFVLYQHLSHHCCTNNVLLYTYVFILSNLTVSNSNLICLIPGLPCLWQARSVPFHTYIYPIDGSPQMPRSLL